MTISDSEGKWGRDWQWDGDPNKEVLEQTPALTAIDRLRSKLSVETEINHRLHSKGDGTVDALCHYSDGRCDALISALEIVNSES